MQKMSHFTLHSLAYLNGNYFHFFTLLHCKQSLFDETIVMILFLVMLANSNLVLFFCCFAFLAPYTYLDQFAIGIGGMKCSQYDHMFDHHIFGTHHKNIASSKQCLIEAFSLLKYSLRNLNKGKCKSQPLLIEIRIILFPTEKMKAVKHQSLHWNKMLCNYL